MPDGFGIRQVVAWVLFTEEPMTAEELTKRLTGAGFEVSVKSVRVALTRGRPHVQRRHRNGQEDSVIEFYHVKNRIKQIG